MSILGAVQTYIKTYGSLATSPVLIDFLGEKPDQYAIVSLPGNKIVEHYLDGGSVREFPFALQAMFSTADEEARLDNLGFFEAFADWLESQTLAGVLPTSLGTGRTAEKIEALGQAFLYEQGVSGRGIYSVQAKLTYSQVP
ncbi:MAG: hypothetical protein V1897_00215 [Pseudomonadota bacterium]